MRIRFQETPWDLYSCAVYTLVVSLVFLAKGGGDFLAIPLIVFVPGYVVVAVLFPKENEIGWLERIALSVGLSIVMSPLLGFLLNFSTLRIGFVSVVAITLLFNLLGTLIAYWRRMSCTAKERLSLNFALGIPDWKEYTPLEKVLTVALVLGVIVAGTALVYVTITPRQIERFTEFYILDRGPNQLNRSESSSVALGISNHEGVAVDYTIRVNLVGVRFVYNNTRGLNETLRVNMTVLSWLNASLLDGVNLARNYSFSIDAVGWWKVEFLLFRDGNLSLTYREVHVFVRVL